jgi:hypothetical protein
LACLAETIPTAASHGICTVVIGVAGHLADRAARASKGAATIITSIAANVVLLAQNLSGSTDGDANVNPIANQESMVRQMAMLM